MNRRRSLVAAVVDALLWIPALAFAVMARFEFDVDRVDLADIAAACGLAMLFQVIVGIGTGLYRGRREVASFEEVLLVAATSLAVGVMLVVVVVVTARPDRLIPVSSVIAATAYQLLGSLGVRYLTRLAQESTERTRHLRSRKALVFGAGDAGRQIVYSLQRDPETDIEPVAFLDDDPSKARLVVEGLSVAGDAEFIGIAASEFHADTLLIAMPSADAERVAAVARRGRRAGLDVLVLPSLHDILERGLHVADIQSFPVATLLGREELAIDEAAVRQHLAGRRIVVTGAGGSIGSELCLQLRRFDPERVVMIDHDANALHALQLRRDGRALLDDPDLVLCDITDRDALVAVFEDVRPHVVFHAAAHKHLTLLERFPVAGYDVNVAGTHTVLEASVASGVERFINVSTDKAADPTSVLGATKRIAERLTAGVNEAADGRYLSVRFGNVLGSSGSVLPVLTEQIRRGETVTITDPDATRYFMTVHEAVALVLLAGSLGRGGDVMVLDMGEPVRIGDLPARIAAGILPDGPEPRVVYTGLRPGEKLHERLEAADDVPAERPHERIRRFVVPPLEPGDAPRSIANDPAALLAAASEGRPGVVIDLEDRTTG